MTFDGRYLHTFWVVCREQGFGRAARRLHRSQPTVSYQVKQLETQLGTPLLERGPRGIALTAAGARVFALCDPFFLGWDQVQGELTEGGGCLRLASVAGFGRYVLYPLLADGLGERRFELRLPTADEVFERVRSGAVELGFSHRPPEDASLAATPVWTEELVLIAPASAAWPAPAPLPCVTWDEHEYVFQRFFEACLDQAPAVDSVHHFEDLEEVVDAVGRGAGWSIVPSFCLPPGGAPRVVRPTDRRCHNEICAVHLPGRLGAAGQRLVEGLRGLGAGT